MINKICEKICDYINKNMMWRLWLKLSWNIICSWLYVHGQSNSNPNVMIVKFLKGFTTECEELLQKRHEWDTDLYHVLCQMWCSVTSLKFSKPL